MYYPWSCSERNSYTLYRCTHPPCPVLIEEAAIRITPLAYFPAPYADMRLKA